MARSVRRTTIFAMTTAETDRPYKAMERRAVKVALRTNDPLPRPRAFGNPWASEKDGK
jgi:hypothetical protein